MAATTDPTTVLREQITANFTTVLKSVRPMAKFNEDLISIIISGPKRAIHAQVTYGRENESIQSSIKSGVPSDNLLSALLELLYQTEQALKAFRAYPTKDPTPIAVPKQSAQVAQGSTRRDITPKYPSPQETLKNEVAGPRVDAPYYGPRVNNRIVPERQQWYHDPGTPQAPSQFIQSPAYTGTTPRSPNLHHTPTAPPHPPDKNLPTNRKTSQLEQTFPQRKGAAPLFNPNNPDGAAPGPSLTQYLRLEQQLRAQAAAAHTTESYLAAANAAVHNASLVSAPPPQPPQPPPQPAPPVNVLSNQVLEAASRDPSVNPFRLKPEMLSPVPTVRGLHVQPGFGAAQHQSQYPQRQHEQRSLNTQELDFRSWGTPVSDPRLALQLRPRQNRAREFSTNSMETQAPQRQRQYAHPQQNPQQQAQQHPQQHLYPQQHISSHPPDPFPTTGDGGVDWANIRNRRGGRGGPSSFHPPMPLTREEDEWSAVKPEWRVDETQLEAYWRCIANGTIE